MRDSNFKVLIKLASVLAVPLIVIYIAMIVFTSIALRLSAALGRLADAVRAAAFGTVMGPMPAVARTDKGRGGGHDDRRDRHIA